MTISTFKTNAVNLTPQSKPCNKNKYGNIAMRKAHCAINAVEQKIINLSDQKVQHETQRGACENPS